MYSQASVMNVSCPPTRIFPSIAFKIPPTEMVGVQVCSQQNMRSHGSCCGFSVGSGYCDGDLVIFHDLSQQFGAADHGDLFLYRSGELRIVRVNGCRVNNQVGSSSILEAF